MDAPKTRKKYDQAFKQKAVEYFFKNKTAVSDAAKRFDISPGMLHKWAEKYGSQESHANSENDNMLLRRNIQSLEKKLSRMSQDVNVLRNIVLEKFTQRIRSVSDSDVVQSILND